MIGECCPPACSCGHVEDEHSPTGECEIEGCLCGCYEEEEI